MFVRKDEEWHVDVGQLKEICDEVRKDWKDIGMDGEKWRLGIGRYQ